MKYFTILIVALLLSSSAAYAQDSTFVSSKKQKRVRLPQIQYHHEFRVGVGIITMPSDVMGCGSKYHKDLHYFTKSSFGVRPFVLSAYYGYKIIKGLKVTLTFSFTKALVQSYEPVWAEKPYYSGWDASDDVIGNDRFYNYRVTPAIQYEWYNRGIVTMYSEVGCTFDFAYHKKELRGETIYSSWDYPNAGGVMAIRPNGTLFGITVGKKLFGYAEVFSFGPRGLFNAGIGYRF